MLALQSIQRKETALTGRLTVAFKAMPFVQRHLAATTLRKERSPGYLQFSSSNKPKNYRNAIRWLMRMERMD